VGDRYRYLLRMPQDLRERVLRATEKSGRSFNAEVLHRLDRSLRPSLAQRALLALGSIRRSVATGLTVRKPQGVRVQGREETMKRRNSRLVASFAVALVVLVAALTAGLLTKGSKGLPAGVTSGESETAGKTLGTEARAFARSTMRRTVRGVPVPMAREHMSPGREASREFVAASEEAYSDLAYPHTTIAMQQQQNALAAAKRNGRDGRGGPGWDEVGPFTLNVAREATQNNGLPTQWAGRTTAMAIDPSCNARDCRLYIGAAGGGVWRTDDALDRNQRWKPLDDGLDTTAIGALLIDPTDKSGKTIYVGTGEPSGSGDSEAGLGLYKSTDRGEHWHLVPGSFPVAKDRGIGEIAVDPLNSRHIWIGTTVARHSLSGVAGGRFTPPGAPTIGLYESKDGGQSFQLRFNLPQDPVNPASPNGDDFFKGGVTDIEYDPVDKSTLYFTMFDYGVFRLKGNGAPQNIYEGAGPDDGATGGFFGIRYELAAAKLRNGKTRLYVHDGRNEVFDDDGNMIDASRVVRTDDARAATPVFEMLSSNVDGTPGFSSFDVCGQQCSYDMPIAVSPKNPDVVMIGGQTQYGELPPYAGADRSNGRNVMLSRNGGRLFTDMSGEAKDPFEANHPDVQILGFNPGDPDILFIASDGGVVRTSGRYVNDSSDCDEPDRNLSGVDLTDCRLWLSYIPDNLITMNAGLRTLQFQDLSVNPNDPLGDVIGGTQDNGTLGYDGSDTWLNFVSGDGGQSGIDARRGNIRYHTYFAQQGDVNFRGNDPQWWSWIFDPILFSPEGSSFYIPFTADPVVSKTAFAGSESVWRTKNAGGDQSFLENHCSVLGGPRSDRLNTGVDSGCGDWVKLGQGSLVTGSSADKGTGYVVAVERARTNNGTIWAGTRRGRIFVAKNADFENTATQVKEPDCCGTGFNERQAEVVFDRVDTAAQPRRFPSGISVDPRDPSGNTAFVSFSGYSAYAPGGHVFKAVYNPATHSATWTDLSHDLGDLPILDVEVDPATGDLYAAHDWGVLRLANGSTNWVDASRGLPNVAVYELTLANLKRGGRVIYAATHGRGGFRLVLGRSDD
jgi:hypothetical protein